MKTTDAIEHRLSIGDGVQKGGPTECLRVDKEMMVCPYPAFALVTAMGILHNMLRYKTNVTTGASDRIPVLRTENNDCVLCVFRVCVRV